MKGGCAALLLAMLAAAPEARAETGWPCGTPAPAVPDASWLWSGARYRADWRGDPAIVNLATAIARRAMPEGEAVTRLTAFAARQSAPAEAMALLGSALIDTQGAELRLVTGGIGRFNVRQAQLAARIEAGYRQTDTAQQNADLQEQIRWDTTIFEDRQRLLPTMCSIPGAITRRLGVLLAAARNAAGVLASDAGYLVYATNELAGEVSILDPARQVEIGRIAIGKRPRGLVASPDHRTLYVAVSGSPIGGPGVDESTLPPPDKAADGIAVVDLATRKVVRTLRGVSDPEQIAISPDGARLFVSSEDAGELLTLDTQGRVLSRLAVGRQPEGVNLAPDGRSLLATSEEDNAVSLVRFSASGAQTIAATLPVGQQPRSSAFLPDGRAVVGGEFDASLTILSTGKTPRVLRTIHLAPEERPMSVKAGPAADGTVYVTTGRGGKLLKIDTTDARAQAPVLAPVLAAASVGERPWGLALSPDGTTGYTANGPGEDITVVDLRTMRVVGKIASPGGPWGIIAVPTR